MTIAYVGIGSNLDPAVHVPSGVAALGEEFAEVACSPVYRTEPVGFEGPAFLNLVARLVTERPVEEVVERLHAIEAAGTPQSAAGDIAAVLDLAGRVEVVVLVARARQQPETVGQSVGRIGPTGLEGGIGRPPALHTRAVVL